VTFKPSERIVVPETPVVTAGVVTFKPALLIVPAVPVLFKAPAELILYPLIVCVVAVVRVNGAVVTLSAFVVPAAADEPVIAPPAMVIPLVVPPVFVAVNVPTEISKPLVVPVPVVLVSNVPVEIFTPSFKSVLPAKFKVEAGVVIFAPAKFTVPAAPPVAIAPALAELSNNPLMFATPVVVPVNAAVAKLISEIVPVTPVAGVMLPPIMSIPFTPPAEPFAFVTV